MISNQPGNNEKGMQVVWWVKYNTQVDTKMLAIAANQKHFGVDSVDGVKMLEKV